MLDVGGGECYNRLRTPSVHAMANEEHLKILRQGVAAWNEWREKNPELHPDLSSADLREANLSGAKLHEAHLKGAHLGQAILNGASLERADLRGVDLFEANLRGAILRKADLRWAFLGQTILRGADLTGAKLGGAQLIETDLCDAMLTGSIVYGVSVWDIKVNERTEQQNLIITDTGEPVITVDDLEVAQFIYLLLNNQKIRKVIDTITSKAVLLLGRFSEERKAVLDALREELRKHGYLPILFDFVPSPNQGTLETIKTLAGMARFVIADLTDARSVLMELGAIVPAFPSVAVRLMIKKSEHEYGMLDSIRLHRSVVEDTYEYEDTDKVIASIRENIIAPAEAKVDEMRRLIGPAAR
jgi:uncharacterized protein YjbI with pentapeptide repeats